MAAYGFVNGLLTAGIQAPEIHALFASSGFVEQARGQYEFP
jgi:hypothetical protein